MVLKENDIFKADDSFIFARKLTNSEIIKIVNDDSSAKEFTQEIEEIINSKGKQFKISKQIKHNIDANDINRENSLFKVTKFLHNRVYAVKIDENYKELGEKIVFRLSNKKNIKIIDIFCP
jgi:hypothetical protein